MASDLCDLCGGVSFRRLPYYYTLKGERIHGAKCRSCGLVSVSPMPPADELKRLYDGTYFEGDYHCGHREGSYEDEPVTKEHARVLDEFVRLKPRGKMLEIGAAGGKFLGMAKERGYVVSGVEVSPEACAIAKGIGLELFCGELEEAGLPDGGFDSVFMGDVLEHLTRPLSTMREVFRVTAPGGVVGVSCPTNIALLSSKAGLLAYSILGRERAAPLPPYHLYEFTPGDLKRLMTKAGFEVVKVDVGIIQPWRIQLRGSPAEKLIKAGLHWPNYIITKLTGLMGDRVTVYARKSAP